jgi:hypothetical protein
LEWISNDIEGLIYSNFYSRLEMLNLISLGKVWKRKEIQGIIFLFRIKKHVLRKKLSCEVKLWWQSKLYNNVTCIKKKVG